MRTRHITIFYTVVGFSLVAALVWVLHANQDDLHAKRAHYCHMVQSGAWPDFRHTYKESCPTQRPRKERSNG